MIAAPALWLTRPAADSDALSETLATHHIQTIVAPLLSIEPCAIALPAFAPDAILLTSRHAAHALLPQWSHLPVYCVGLATAQTAQAQGFLNIISGDNDVLSLLPRIAETLKNKTLLYLSGEDISVDVASLLASQSVQVTRLIAYRAIAATQLSPRIVDALKNNSITGTVFFSARTAEIAHQLLVNAELTDAIRNTDAYCLSLAIAEKAAALPWRRLHVAHLPTADAMQTMIVGQHSIN